MVTKWPVVMRMVDFRSVRKTEIRFGFWYKKSEPFKIWHLCRWLSDRNCVRSAVQIKSDNNLVDYVFVFLVFGGEKWKTNFLLTAVFCPGYVSGIFRTALLCPDLLFDVVSTSSWPFWCWSHWMAECRRIYIYGMPAGAWCQLATTVLPLGLVKGHLLWLFHVFGTCCQHHCILSIYPSLGLIWTVMLVWMKGNINRTASVL